MLIIEKYLDTLRILYERIGPIRGCRSAERQVMSRIEFRFPAMGRCFRGSRAGMLFLLLARLGIPDAGAQTPFWGPNSGPEGGAVTAISAGTRGEMYAVTWAGGVFRSENMGIRWEKTSLWQYWEIAKPLRVVIDGSGKAYVSFWKIMLESSDFGKSWLPMENLPFAGGSLYLDSQDNLVAEMDGTWRRRKDGSWIKINDQYFRYPVFVSDSVAWAVTNSKIMRSTNGLVSWDSIRAAHRPTTIHIIQNGYIFVTERDTISSIYDLLTRSTDGGRSWVVVDSIMDSFESTRILELPDGMLIRNDHRYRKGGILRISSDKGTTWQTQSWNLPTGTEIDDMLLSGDTLYIATLRGIYASGDEGRTWLPRRNNLAAPQITSIATTDSMLYAATLRSGLFKSSDHGETWSAVDTLSDITVGCIAFGPNGVMFASPSSQIPDKRWDDGVYRSPDMGKTWTRSDRGMGGHLDKMIFVDSLRIYALYAAGGLYRSTDGGYTWESRDRDIIGSHWYSDLCMDSNGILYLATDEYIYRSTDGMESWKYIQGSMTETQITAVAVARDGTVYCAPMVKGVYKSSDKGQNWEQCSGHEFDGKKITRLLVDPDGWIYAATEPYFTEDGGVWRSRNEGRSWEKLATGMTTQRIELLHLGRDRYLYAGTWGSGIFRSTGEVTSVRPPPRRAPAPEIRHEIYPTVIGSRSAANIRITLGTIGPLRIDLFDRLGRRLKRVYEGEARPGEQVIPLAMDGMSSGTYSYLIEFDGRYYTKSFVLLR